MVKKYLANGSVEFNYSKMQVKDDANTVALNKMTFANGVEILDANVTASASVAANGVLIKNGGTLTVASAPLLNGITVEYGELVVNNTSFFTNQTSGDRNVATAYYEVNNSGVATGNVGTITLNVGDATNEVTKNVYSENIKLAGGKIYVAQYTSLRIETDTETNFAEGDIENEGNLYVGSSFTIAEDVELTHEGTITFGSTAVLTNEGTIYNYKDLVVTNTGSIEMKDEFATLNVYGVGGEVENTVKAYVNVDGHRDNQTVWYTYSTNVDNKTANWNYNDGYTINALRIKGATFSMTEDVALASYANKLGWIGTIELDNATFAIKNDHTVGQTKFIITGASSITGWGSKDQSKLNLQNAATVEMNAGSSLTVKTVTLNATSTQLDFIGTQDEDGKNPTVTLTNAVLNINSITNVTFN